MQWWALQLAGKTVGFTETEISVGGICRRRSLHRRCRDILREREYMRHNGPMLRATLARTTCPEDVAKSAHNLHQAFLLLQEVRRLHAVARWRGHSDRDVSELLGLGARPKPHRTRNELIDAASD